MGHAGVGLVMQRWMAHGGVGLGGVGYVGWEA